MSSQFYIKVPKILYSLHINSTYDFIYKCMYVYHVYTYVSIYYVSSIYYDSVTCVIYFYVNIMFVKMNCCCFLTVSSNSSNVDSKSLSSSAFKIPVSNINVRFGINFWFSGILCIIYVILKNLKINIIIL